MSLSVKGSECVWLCFRVFVCSCAGIFVRVGENVGVCESARGGVQERVLWKIMRGRERHRDRETETKTERDRETETETERPRQTETDRDRQIQRQR